MQRMITLAGVVAMSLLVCLGQSAVARDKRPDKSDQKFVHMASSAGLAEVHMGQLATERAASAEVKQFAQRMVDDHSKANQDLASLAQAKNIPVAQEMDQTHRAKADRLAKLNGAAFDHAYMAGQVQDHEQAVALFTTESKAGRDADLKAFAAQTLPTLQDHLRMARDLMTRQQGNVAQK